MADFLRTTSNHLRAAVREQPTVETEVHFRAVLDGLPAAIYTTDAIGRITYYNEAAATLWGHRPQLGTSEWCGSWKLFRPDGSELLHAECPMALAIQDKRPYRGLEAIAERPDGTRVPFLPYPTPLFDADGILIGAVNMLVDITERKHGEESAQRLAAIVESSDDAIITKDLNGIIQTWNKGAERLFGYSSEEIIGKPVSLLMPEERRDEATSILARVRRGEHIDHYETVRMKKDGTLLDISLSVSPVKGANGAIVGVSKIARNIGHLKRALQQRELLLREMDHRVKNLFALASGIVTLGARTAATPKDLAHTVGERLGALARAHALTISGSPRAADQSATLHALISAIMLPFGGRTDADQPRIRTGGMDTLIAGEAVTAFALLLHEFATNAAKYGALSTPDGQVEITTTESGGFLVLVWKESGGPLINCHPVHEGFGTVLTRMTVTSQLSGEVTYDWQPDGLCIRLSVRRDRLQPK